MWWVNDASGSRATGARAPSTAAPSSSSDGNRQHPKVAAAQERLRIEQERRQKLQEQMKALQAKVMEQQRQLTALLDQRDHAIDRGPRPGQLESFDKRIKDARADLKRLNGPLREAQEKVDKADLTQAQSALWKAQNEVNLEAKAAGKEPPYKNLGTDPAKIPASLFDAPNLTAAERQKLTGALQGTLEQTPVRDAVKAQIEEAVALNPASATNYSEVLKSIEGLPGDVQARLLEVATRNLGADLNSVHSLTGSAGWQTADPAQKATLVSLAARTRPESSQISNLAAVADSPTRLFSTDKDGKSLLDNLHELSLQPQEARLTAAGNPPDELFDSVLSDAANPNTIGQSNYGTCTVTSMQYELVRDQPSEYVRLMREMNADGTADMRGGGSLELQAEYLRPQEGDERNLSQALFQSSLMEFSDGRFEYHANTDQESLGDSPKRIDAALPPEDQAKGMSALFGTPFQEVKDLKDTLSFLREYQTRAGNPPVLLGININPKLPGWADVKGDTLDPKFKAEGHAVTFLRMEGDRIFFRNPWGSSTKREGSIEPGVGRLEDPITGTYSMSVEEFTQRRLSVVVDEAAWNRFENGENPSFANPGLDADPMADLRAVQRSSVA